MSKLKRYICILYIYANVVFQPLHANDDFENLGDILTLAPFGMLAITISLQDWEGTGQLILGSLAAQGTVELMKRTFQYSHDIGLDVGLAKRPCCDIYQGMASGHSAGGFSAAGFIYYRYGWKPAIPVIGLAVITAASRVYAKKHTILQVAIGGAISWAWAYIFTTKYNHPSKMKVMVMPDIRATSHGGFYGINMSYRW